MGRVDSPNVVNVADLRKVAKNRLPRVVFDYIDGGADAEWTMRENARVFDDVMFRPRSAVATPNVDLRTTVLGTTIDLPLLLAPVGSARLFYPRGEEVAARVAGDAGTIYALSTLSGCAVRDVKAATRGPVWYQLYLLGGRDVATAGIERAKNCGCSALVVTVDTPVAGLRERDIRNGTRELVSGGRFAMLPYVLQFFARPRWFAAYLRDGGLMSFPDVVKALCVGARAVLIGRAYAYGLGAAGGEGVAQAINVLRSGMVRTMKLLGCASVRDLDRSLVQIPASWLE